MTVELNACANEAREPEQEQRHDHRRKYVTGPPFHLCSTFRGTQPLSPPNRDRNYVRKAAPWCHLEPGVDWRYVRAMSKASWGFEEGASISDQVEDEDALRDLSEEAEMLASVAHPVIVRGFDAVLRQGWRDRPRWRHERQRRGHQRHDRGDRRLADRQLVAAGSQDSA